MYAIFSQGIQDTSTIYNSINLLLLHLQNIFQNLPEIKNKQKNKSHQLLLLKQERLYLQTATKNFLLSLVYLLNFYPFSIH